MKYKTLFLILPVLFAIAMSSCEKDIVIDIPKPDPKYVIEGWIENGKPAIVIITKSAPYFDPIDSATLANSLVMGATVKVSDGISTETLALGLNPEYYPYIMYVGSTITGQVGKTYTLSVTIDTNVFTASTTILNPVSFDSAWFKVEPNKDTLGYMWANCTDNGATEDFYRVFTKRKGKDIGFVPMYGSTWSDKYFNGQQFTISIYRGEASFLVDFSDSEKDEFTYFKVGDTIITKLTHFEEAVYNFWSAAESEIFSGGNPFSTPAVIPTNIQGGALGVWSGYASTYDTIVATY